MSPREKIQHKGEERENEQHAKRRIRRRIPKSNKENGANLDPYPAEKRMLIQDFPHMIKGGGEEIMEIPAMLDKKVIEIIQQ